MWHPHLCDSLLLVSAKLQRMILGQTCPVKTKTPLFFLWMLQNTYGKLPKSS